MDCLFHHFKVVDDQGHFDHDKTIAKLTAEWAEDLQPIVISIAGPCKPKQIFTPDMCENAYALHECWKATDPYVIFTSGPS